VLTGLKRNPRSSEPPHSRRNLASELRFDRGQQGSSVDRSLSARVARPVERSRRHWGLNACGGESSTSRTLQTSASEVIGFCKRATPESTTPW
jgi:hypothetical protein